MAISTGLGLALAAAGTVASTVIGAGAAGKAANVQAEAATQAGALSQQATLATIASQERQFEQTRTDLAPWREAGGAALNQYAGYLGIPGYGPQAATGPSGGPVPQVYGTPQPYIEGAGGAGALRAGGGIPPGYLTAGDYAEDYGYGNEGFGVGPRGREAGGPRFGGGLPAYGGSGGGSPAQAIEGQYTVNGEAAPIATTPGGGTAPLDFSQALALTPQYQFMMSEGVGAIERSAAAGGELRSGRTLKALEQFRTGLVQGISESYLNRLQNLAGLGQTTAVQTGYLGANVANATGQAIQTGAANQSQALQYGASSRASGYLNQAEAINQGIGGIAGYLGYSTGSYGVPRREN